MPLDGHAPRSRRHPAPLRTVMARATLTAFATGMGIGALAGTVASWALFFSVVSKCFQ